MENKQEKAWIRQKKAKKMIQNRKNKNKKQWIKEQKTEKKCKFLVEKKENASR